MATTISSLLKSKQKNMGNTAITIEPVRTVYEALELMQKENVGALAVVQQDGQLVGIFSERDYARKVGVKDLPVKTTLIEEVMTPQAELIRTATTATAMNCAIILDEGHIRHLPVFDTQGNFAGILSVRDILRAVINDQTLLLEEYISTLTNRS